MKTIWKFPLAVKESQNLSVPAYNRPIHVGLDIGGKPCLWAEVDTVTIPRPMTVYVVCTGQELISGTKYLGSLNYEGEVWHVYYK